MSLWTSKQTNLSGGGSGFRVLQSLTFRSGNVAAPHNTKCCKKVAGFVMRQQRLLLHAHEQPASVACTKPTTHQPNCKFVRLHLSWRNVFCVVCCTIALPHSVVDICLSPCACNGNRLHWWRNMFKFQCAHCVCVCLCVPMIQIEQLNACACVRVDVTLI